MEIVRALIVRDNLYIFVINLFFISKWKTEEDENEITWNCSNCKNQEQYYSVAKIVII